MNEEDYLQIDADSFSAWRSKHPEGHEDYYLRLSA